MFSLIVLHTPPPKFHNGFVQIPPLVPPVAMPMSLTIVACWGNLNTFRKIYNMLDNIQEDILTVIKDSLLGSEKVSA